MDSVSDATQREPDHPSNDIVPRNSDHQNDTGLYHVNAATAANPTSHQSPTVHSPRGQLPPSFFYGEQLPYFNGSLVDFQSHDSPQGPTGAEAPLLPDATIAHLVNERINGMVGRVPSGGSVVEPNSVLGESGRLYHGYKEGKYFLPNDAAEQDRLDLQHEVVSQLLDGWLALAPLTTTPRYVLDIGTGTGLWASEFAEQNPSSYVIGTDLSSIQPYPRVGNCVFIKADAEDEWIFPISDADHSDCFETTGGKQACNHFITFDYIHLRMMYTCFNDATVVMRHALENLAPGGWIEFLESRLKCFQANAEFPGDALQRWSDGCIRGAAALGRDVECVLHYENWLKEVGFVNVTQRVFLAPFGEWHEHPKMKRVGMYNRQNLLQGLRGVGWKMLRHAGMQPAEIETLLQQAEQEQQDKKNHSYILM
ncbi:S-adenosyl-L-methionine-dependent methyltransferase [Xylariales sp. PMI_506]|nr:S-adenosyl-L-methionine-dependent methyltransferase [Xylariales sp. PMI_506]